MSRFCPDCRNGLLTATHYEGEEIDVCRQCGGLWFANNELDAILSRVDNGDDNANFFKQLGKPLGLSARGCPQCGEKMQGYHLLEHFEMAIDMCHPCSSTWIDQDELEHVRQSPRLKAELGNINQSVNWKTWLFQFLSQMPVEYNLKARSRPWVTWALIILNCLIYFSYASDGYLTETVFEFFASRPSDVMHGVHWWTPLTATFLHGSLLHLVGNMYFLWVTGDNIEDAIGHWRYLALYLFCGVSASAFSILADTSSDIQSLGASGAIAGLFGLYMIWFPYARFSFMILVYQLKIPVLAYFGIWLLINFFGMVTGGGGVDYWAHIGGFIIGTAVAVLTRSYVHRQNPLLAMLSGPQAKFLRR